MQATIEFAYLTVKEMQNTRSVEFICNRDNWIKPVYTSDDIVEVFHIPSPPLLTRVNGFPCPSHATIPTRPPYPVSKLHLCTPPFPHLPRPSPTFHTLSVYQLGDLGERLTQWGLV